MKRLAWVLPVVCGCVNHFTLTRIFSPSHTSPVTCLSLLWLIAGKACCMYGDELSDGKRVWQSGRANKCLRNGVFNATGLWR